MTTTSVDRINGARSSLAIKAPCIAATTANITLSGEQTIDGIACVTDDRVLVKDQTTTTANGIYVVDSGAWSRAPDFDGNEDITKGTITLVVSGTTNSNTYWRVTTTGDITIGSSNITFEEALFGDISTMSFTQAGAGATTIGAQAKMRDIVSVKDFGATGDGVTDDDTFIDAALTYAEANNALLYWPFGNYLCNSNLSNFWDVRHIGKATITRGASTFYISPNLAQTNNIYVATTGLDTNDGMVSTSPLLTVQKACDVIAEYAPRLPGRWVINLAAGTYTENVTIDSNTDSEYPIYIQGPDVTHPTVPTAIIAASVTSESVLNINYGGHFVVVDVKLSGATTDSGLEVNASRVTFTNVHIAGCLNGITAINGTHFTAVGGIWTGRGSGVANGNGYKGLFNVVHDIGGTSSVNATQITAYERGILVDEGTQGHLDFAQVSSCVTGLNIKRGAGACNTDDMTIDTCTTGVLVENNGWYNNNITLTACTTNVNAIGGSPELSYLTLINEAHTMRQIENSNAANHTGTVAKTMLWDSELLENWMFGRSGHTLKLQIYGTCAATTAAITVRAELENEDTTTMAFGNIVLPIGTTSYNIEMICSYKATTAFRTISIASVNTAVVAPVYGTPTLTVIDKTSTVKLYCTLGDTGDSFLAGDIIFSHTLAG